VHRSQRHVLRRCEGFKEEGSQRRKL
jgi:hypothetical protein